MESTWESRELPILDAVVRRIDRGEMPEVKDIADDTGREDLDEVHRVLVSLGGPYLTYRQTLGGVDGSFVQAVSPQARSAVGQWPGPEATVDRLVQALFAAADQEPNHTKKGRLRAAAETIGGFARDVAVGVISNAATAPLK